MKKELMNLFIFVIVCFMAYLLFRNLNFKEGMTDASGNDVSIPTTTNGIAGNAAAYGATIKSATIKMQDMFLISKYRTDYENAVLNLDDLINNLMLKTALSVDKENPGDNIKKLAELQQSKIALNSVMKFIDTSK